MSENEKSSQTENQETNLYEKFVSRSKELFEAAREKTADTYNSSMESAKEELVKAGDVSREKGEQLKTYLERDLKNTGEGFKQFKETFKPESVRTGIQNTFADIFNSLGNTFSEWSARIEDNLTYKTGELTSPGILMCKKCGSEMTFQKTARIPPCPKCTNTSFKKTH